MKILLWHGYLLAGSGSNVYTANVARCWRNMGHDVLIVCQDHNAASFDFVDAHGDFEASNAGFHVEVVASTPAPGQCCVVRPAIGNMLPVYVYDDYEHFSAVPFVDVSDEDLEAYTSANVKALAVALEAHEPDASIIGHEVMGPYIARLAYGATKSRYVAKLHGSALEYAVKAQKRYQGFAAEGLGAASAVVGGSEYMVEEAARVVPGWRDRATVVNPGCDVELFVPRPRPPRPPRIAFVGKLLAAKGVHNFLAALPLIEGASSDVLVVGDGSFDSDLRALWDAISTGDPDAALRIAGSHPELEHVAEFLATTGAPYFSRAAGIDLRFTGYLDHEALAPVLSELDVLVVPSVVPEAFGMIAAEAAACGVLPIVADHSGLGEVGRILESELGRPGLLTFPPDSPIEGVAAAVERVISIPAGERQEMGLALADLARRRWSWQRVAKSLLDVALER